MIYDAVNILAKLQVVRNLRILGKILIDIIFQGKRVFILCGIDNNMREEALFWKICGGITK